MSILISGGHREYQERGALGYRWLWPGHTIIGFPTPPQLHGTKILLRQELPDHPRSRFAAGVQGPDVAPTVTNTIITRQHLPDHPRSVFVIGKQGPNVYTKTTDYVFIRQEQPWHPLFPRSQLFSAPPPVPKVLSFVNPIMVKQEMPWHPASYLHPGTPAIDFEDMQFFVIL